MKEIVKVVIYKPDGTSDEFEKNDKTAIYTDDVAKTITISMGNLDFIFVNLPFVITYQTI